MMQGEITWAINIDEYDTASPILEPLPLEPWDKPRIESGRCSCLLTSISFLERLVSKSASRENRIDLLLADVRNSIETLAIFIACKTCADQVEPNMLLAMAARQISLICEKMSNCYKGMRMSALGDPSALQRRPEPDAPAGPVEISVSTYRVNRRESLHLVKSLVTLQITELQKHINTIKSRNHKRTNQGQIEALVEAENCIKLAYEQAIESNI